MFHEGTKHTEVNCHFIEEAFDDNILSFPQVPFRPLDCQQLHQNFDEKSASVLHKQIVAG